MRTHRCIDCPQRQEHEEDELCPSCGRCEDHCNGIMHAPMQEQSDELRELHNRGNARNA